MAILFALFRALKRWSYCKGCGDRTMQLKTEDGWVCECGYTNR